MRLVLVALCALLASAVAAQAAGEGSAPAPRATERLHVLMINGGGDPDENYRSHLVHLAQMAEVLAAAGVPRERVSVLSSDGESPARDLAVRVADPDDFWRLEGTGLDRWLSEPLTHENSVLPGFPLASATRGNLTRFFEQARRRLRAGDTLLVYVTDHGSDNPRDPLDNRITLWAGDSISVRQLRALLGRLPRGVRVVTLMSQCFSGGFARLMDAPGKKALPSGAVCGYFASTEDRPAYGCYPEAVDRDGTGHSFAMLGALGRTGRLGLAHASVLVGDQTPDVPLRTSDVFLADRVTAAARHARKDEAALVEQLLEEAGRSPTLDASVRADRALVERVARGFAFAPPRKLADVETEEARMEALARTLEAHRKLWDDARKELTASHFDRFLVAHPGWRARLRPGALRALTTDGRRGLTRQLLDQLRAFTDEDAATKTRLEALLGKGDAAHEVYYRLEIREAVLLRLRWLLVRMAGRLHLVRAGSAEERAAMAALETCEDLALGAGSSRDPAPAPEPFPTLAFDEAQASTLRPAWLGVRFGPVPARTRLRARLHEGAALVAEVMAGSPARLAGVRPGDVLVATDGRPLQKAGELRAWAMLAPTGEPHRLELLRDKKRLTVSVTLLPSPSPSPSPQPGPRRLPSRSRP